MSDIAAHLINNTLCNIDMTEPERILLYACECSSRTYGFSDRHSDHDIRAVTCERADEYLRITPLRDVRSATTGDLDIVAWDLSKFLSLLSKSNPSTIEWLTSPTVYFEHDAFVPVHAFAKRAFDPKTLAFHYLGMARKHDTRYLENHETPSVKRSLHTLRSTLSAQHVIETLTPAPHSIATLLDLIDTPEMKTHAEALLIAKRGGHGNDPDPDIELTRRWAQAHIDALHTRATDLKPRRHTFSRDDLNRLFRNVVRQATLADI